MFMIYHATCYMKASILKIFCGQIFANSANLRANVKLSYSEAPQIWGPHSKFGGLPFSGI